MGCYVVIYEQVFPKYHRMSVGARRKIAWKSVHRPSFILKLILSVYTSITILRKNLMNCQGQLRIFIRICYRHTRN